MTDTNPTPALTRKNNLDGSYMAISAIASSMRETRLSTNTVVVHLSQISKAA